MAAYLDALRARVLGTQLRPNRHSIYEVAAYRFKADFSKREPSESGDATGTTS